RCGGGGQLLAVKCELVLPVDQVAFDSTGLLLCCRSAVAPRWAASPHPPCPSLPPAAPSGVSPPPHPNRIGTRAMTIALLRRAGPPAAALTLVAATPLAQAKITSPKEQFGFNLGDDYQLATYTQLTEYSKKIDAESERMTL